MISTTTRKELFQGVGTMTATFYLFIPAQIYCAKADEFFTSPRIFLCLGLLFSLLTVSNFLPVPAGSG